MFKKIILSFFLFFSFILQTFAHPLDISASYFSFNKNYLSITTYFHSYEIEYLLSKNGIETKSVYEYYNYQNVIKDYIKKSIKLKSDNIYCEIEKIDLLELEEYQILSKGMEINYNFKCNKDIKLGQIEVYFFDNFPLQTNQITIYNLNDKSISSTPISTSVLNSNVKIYSFDLSKNFKKCVIDTDGDGISDDEELIYKTDVKNIDSDGDNYTDYEEIFNSWLPLDRHMGPKQEPREKIPEYILENVKKNIKTASDCEAEKSALATNINNNGILSNNFTNNYFTSTLESIGKYVKSKENNGIFFILLAVVGLGFIHALGPGHSKSLLISYILDKNKNFFDGLLFITIFTITHLIDIVLLFLITKIIFNFYDITNYMLYIQRISLVILFGFSLFLIFRAYISIKKNENEVCKNDIKSSIFMGFVSGLAPCTFGWSIFLLLFSMGSLSLILPMILALGIGIFLCLLFILTLTFLLRRKVFEKINNFSKYSSLISSLVLFLLSIYLIVKIY